jgi:hypothetical protein
MILASVADDPEVKEAAARWDRATPSTHYDDLGPRVLAFCISTYQHGNIDGGGPRAR